MLNKIAQLITIVSYGNEYLNNKPNNLDEKNNSSFALCGKVIFKDCTGERKKTIARGANEWFEYLKEKGYTKLRLIYKKDNSGKSYTNIMITNSVEWYIEADAANKTEFWSAEWRYSMHGWDVDYCMDEQVVPSVSFGDLEQTRTDLERSFLALSEFADSVYLHKDSRIFKNCISLLHEDDPKAPEERKDLIPEDRYSKAAKQLIFTIVTSWCFNGMGSWSDVCVSNKDTAEKEELTNNLFYSICNAIVCAVNSY